ncbi:MAG TPA: hypothetical protein VFQ53_05940 [Kofleriaceae bacterium]|nr:hypothetical protein [Kofleriaceae bacterium]
MRLVVLCIVLAACEPEYDGTAFHCDDAHGCPSDQRCFAGRCRRVAVTAIQCGDVACGPDQQCCSDVINGNRCIGATEVCDGDPALCDGKDDCAANERCCVDPTLTLCVLECLSDDVACTTDADCPSDAFHCCPQATVPWGRCSSLAC